MCKCGQSSERAFYKLWWDYMRERKPCLTIEELTSDEALRQIEKRLDDHLERSFRGSDPKTYAEFKAAMRADYKSKNNDKLWLLDYWKENWRKYFKMQSKKIDSSSLKDI